MDAGVVNGKVFLVTAKDGKREHLDISDSFVGNSIQWSVDPEIDGVKEEELSFDKTFSATVNFTFEAGEGYQAFKDLLYELEIERFKAAFEKAKETGQCLIVVTREFSTNYYLAPGKAGAILYLYPKEDEEAFVGENELKNGTRE